MNKTPDGRDDHYCNIITTHLFLQSLANGSISKHDHKQEPRLPFFGASEPVFFVLANESISGTANGMGCGTWGSGVMERETVQ
jgi:hypothetical protein